MLRLGWVAVVLMVASGCARGAGQTDWSPTERGDGTTGTEGSDLVRRGSVATGPGASDVGDRDGIPTGELPEEVIGGEGVLADAGFALANLCAPGRYVGEYELQFPGTELNVPSVVSRPLMFEMETAPRDGYVQTVSGTQFEMHFIGLVFNATIRMQGGIDCVTGEFEARATDCDFDVVGVPLTECFADMLGSFDESTHTITGIMSAEGPGGLGEGTFSMQLQ